MKKLFTRSAFAAVIAMICSAASAQTVRSNGISAGTAAIEAAAVYSIGSSSVTGESGHFASLKAACDSLNAWSGAGITSDMIFYITSDLTEISNSALGPNTNGHTITFKPSAGMKPTITFAQIAANSGLAGSFVIGLKNLATASSSNYGLTASDSTERIVIDGSNTNGGTTRDLTLTTLSTSHYTSTPIVIFGNTNFVTVKNVTITAAQAASGSSSSSTYAVRIAPRFSTINYIPDNITIDNCGITSTALGASQGIAVLNDGTPTQFPSGIVISNNKIAATTRGIILTYSGNTDIIGNEISVNQTLSGYLSEGIFANTVGSASSVTNIYNNKFTQLKTANVSGGTGAGIYGIYVQTQGVYNIYNNLITGFSFPNGFQGVAAGIGVSTATINGITANIYHNSVLMSDGLNTAGTTTPPIESAFYLNLSGASGTRAVNLKNNIFATAEPDYATYAFYWSNTSYPTVQSNHNVLFTAGGSGRTGRYGATDAALLADWTAAAKLDTNSVSGDPQFISASDLHIKYDASPTSSASNAGLPIAAVTRDIDGDLRSTTTPDIGADEFTAVTIIKAPVFTAAPAVLDFKTVIINQEKTDSVVVTNTGNDSLFITNVTSSDSVFTVTPATAQLDTARSATFYVTYKPIAVGVKAALLLFSNNTKKTLDSVTVVGTGVPVPAPVFTLMPTSLNFRNVKLNTPVRDSVVVKNTGTDTLIIRGTGSNDQAYTITPDAAVLDTGASAKFYVTYTPSTTGMKTALIFFTSNVADVIDTLLVSGSGLSPVAISEARKDLNSDLIADHSVTRDTLFVYGVITTPNLQTTQTSYFMQDSTGGINLFSTATLAAPLDMGDSVFAVGTVAQFRGLAEFTPLGLDSLHFGVIKHNAKIPTARRVWLRDFVKNAEKYEGQLIEVDSLFKASGTWPALGSNGSVFATGLSKTDTAQIFVDLDTDIDGSPEPKYPINVVGVVSQYTTSATVYNNGYEIVPRHPADFTPIIILGVDDIANALPKSYELMNNYPNPFNPSTQIKFALPKSSMTKLVVYDMLGREVKTLVNGVRNAGYYEVTWDGSNNHGIRVSSGMYLYRIEAGSFVQIKKMMLLK